MGTSEQRRNQTEKVAGKAKEAVGKATGDEELENQGRGDQVKGDLKQAGEKARQAGHRAADSIKEAFDDRP